MNTVLVTGGAGFVGAVLVPKLARAGYRVRVLDLFLFAEMSLFDECPGVEVLRGDMCREDLLKRALDGVGTVIHLAGISNDPSSDLDPELTRRVNVDASRLLIDLAREAGVKRFLNASSSSVYGIKEEPDVTEDLPLAPLTVYSESKVLIEAYLKERKGPMVGVSVRSATVCGVSPRMRLDLTVNLLTHHALSRGKITVFGGSQKRPNIHIDDVTDLYRDLITAPAGAIDGREFNVCAANHTVRELAEMVREVAAPGVPIEVTPTDDLRSYHVSGERIRRELGFVPRKGIADAIRDVARAIRGGAVPAEAGESFFNIRVMKRLLAEGRAFA